MAYSTVTDVAALLPPVQQATGATWFAPLTLAQVEAIGTGIAAEIDARLAGCGYTTPVTSPAGALAYLLAVETWGWAAAIQRSRFRDQHAANTESAWKFWQEKYTLALTGLCDWAEGAIGSVAAVHLPTSYWTVNPDTDPDLGANAEPTITTKTVW